VKISVRSFLSLALFVCLWPGASKAQQQQPPAAPPPDSPQDQQPRQTGIQPLPPAPPKVPDVRQPGETGWWIGVNGWFPAGKPYFEKGRDAAFTDPSRIDFEGKPKVAGSGEVGIALGLHNALRFTYLTSHASGDYRTPIQLQLWDQTYAAGTLIATNYHLQNGKISFDYLTWPYPVESRRFRLKTLWAVQYTEIRGRFDAPELPLVDSNGIPFVDSAGNPISYAGEGSRWFISPELGIGVAYYSGRHFRVEANASGFTIPRHNTIWDADASANVRFGHFEFRVGGKGFHFKTGTGSDFYMRGTLYGAFAGLRWYSD
jgi:hypothetical protein